MSVVMDIGDRGSQPRHKVALGDDVTVHITHQNSNLGICGELIALSQIGAKTSFNTILYISETVQMHSVAPDSGMYICVTATIV